MNLMNTDPSFRRLLSKARVLLYVEDPLLNKITDGEVCRKVLIKWLGEEENARKEN